MKPNAKALSDRSANCERSTLGDRPTPEEPRLPQHHRGSLLFSIACCLTLALVVAVVFGGARHFDIVHFDDPLHLTGNPFIQPDSPDRFAHFWREPYGKLYVPITYNVWAIVYASCFDRATGLFDASLLHVLNIATHALNAGLVFVLLRRLLKDRPARLSQLNLAAMCGALLFAVHPLQVESVAWISEFRGLLAAFFGIAAWITHLHASDVRSRGVRVAIEALATLCFAAALLSKPSAAALPLMVAATDWLLLRRSAREITIALSSWFVLTFACLIRMRTLQVTDIHYAGPFLGRPVIAVDSVVFYLSKLVWPVDLCADYSRTPRYVLGTTGIWWTWIIPAWIAALLIWKPKRITVTSAAVFVVALLPVLGLVPFEFQRLSTVADRYAYLALIAPALFVTAILLRRVLFVPAALVVLCMLGWKSVGQIATWKDDSTLWTHAAAVNPRAVIANANLAVAAADRGDTAQARQRFERVIALDPSRSNGYVGIGSMLLNTGHAEESITWFDRAASAEPTLAEPHVFAGEALQTLGQTAEAEKRFQTAIEREPQAITALCDLADLKLSLAQTDEASTLVDRVLAIDPRNVRAWMLKAQLADARQNSRGYIDALNRAAKFAGTDTSPIETLGRFAMSTQDWSAAIDCYERSLMLVPDRAPIMVELATAYAQSGNPDRAIALLERAQLLVPDSPVIQNNLQAAKTLKQRQQSATPTDQKQ